MFTIWFQWKFRKRKTSEMRVGYLLTIQNLLSVKQSPPALSRRPSLNTSAESYNRTSLWQKVSTDPICATFTFPYGASLGYDLQPSISLYKI